MEDAPDATVVDNPAELRYELRLGSDVVGQIRYVVEPGLVVLVHTEVAESIEGMGLGSVRYRARELAVLMFALVVVAQAGVWLLNEPYVPADRVLPRLYFSASWHGVPTSPT